MALSSDNDMVMPVAPMVGGYGNGFGNSFGGDSWAWIILLLLLAGNNGWGNNNGGSNGIMPYMWNSQTQNEVSRGFDNAAVTNQLAGINSAITSGFAGAEISRANAATNIMQGFNGIQSQLAQCCCENRLASANLGSDLAREACANRTALADSTQKILDQMCQDKIDAKNERIADLERQLTLANLAASQGAQTAQILADNARQTTVLEDYLNPVARPAYIVANPNCCQQNVGCGCNGF
ncbi:MAG: hypothetical protein J6Y02_23705 [Pseudobutyrivibrio sp.]|nr:hypothetical protein [Pseudobutyrivibrio sp.]